MKADMLTMKMIRRDQINPFLQPFCDDFIDYKLDAMLYLEEGQIFDDQYQLIKLIDTGGFAEVWKARNVNAENVVALKIYPKMDEQGANAIKAEYNRLFELQHSYLLNALHFGKFKGFPYFEMRFYPGGNASERINLVDETEIARCIEQVASVLNYLHQNNIVHQDIKPNNILLDQKGNYYLADVGLSLKLRDTLQKFTHSKTQDLSSSQTGTTPFAYRAPELYDRYRTDTTPLKETDIWAFGATIYEILTGEPPFGELGGIIQNTDPFIKPLPNKYSSDLYDIISSCLEKDITKRPTAAKLEKVANNFKERGKWDNKREEQIKDKSGIEDTSQESAKTVLVGRESTVNISRENPTISETIENPSKYPVIQKPKKKWPTWKLTVIGIVMGVVIFIGMNNSSNNSYETNDSVTTTDTRSVEPASNDSTTVTPANPDSSKFPTNTQDNAMKMPNPRHEENSGDIYKSSDYLILGEIPMNSIDNLPPLDWDKAKSGNTPVAFQFNYGDELIVENYGDLSVKYSMKGYTTYQNKDGQTVRKISCVMNDVLGDHTHYNFYLFNSKPTLLKVEYDESNNLGNIYLFTLTSAPIIESEGNTQYGAASQDTSSMSDTTKMMSDTTKK